MKKIVIVMLLVYLTSCYSRIQAGRNWITGKSQWSSTQCVYYVENPYSMPHNTGFIDSCNKWNIGDTVYITTKKP